MWPQNKKLNQYQFTADYLEVEFDIGCNDFLMQITLTSGRIIYVKFIQRYTPDKESSLQIVKIDELEAIARAKVSITTDIHGEMMVFLLTDEAAQYLMTVASIIKGLIGE